MSYTKTWNKEAKRNYMQEVINMFVEYPGIAEEIQRVLLHQFRDTFNEYQEEK